MPPLQHLGGDEGEVARVAAAAAAAPVGEADGVGGVLGDAERFDEGGGEGGLLEAVGAALAVEGREDEARRP